MSIFQQIITIFLCVLGTQITRWISFIVFSTKKTVPPVVEYLGKMLPPAVFGMLLIYCLKNIDFIKGSHGIPEILSVLITSLFQIWRKNMFLSIFVGTAVYMVFVNLVFV